MAAAVQNLYAIPATPTDRPVNAGLVGGGTTTNVIPRSRISRGKLRGDDRTGRVHVPAPDRILGRPPRCTTAVAVSTKGEAPSATSDDALARIVGEVAGGVAGVTEIVDRADLGRSSGGRHLPDAVGPDVRGDLACYVGVGTDRPAGTTSTFDGRRRHRGERDRRCSRARPRKIAPRRGRKPGDDQNRTSDSAELPFQVVRRRVGFYDHWRPRIQQTTYRNLSWIRHREAVIRCRRYRRA